MEDNFYLNFTALQNYFENSSGDILIDECAGAQGVLCDGIYQDYRAKRCCLEFQPS